MSDNDSCIRPCERCGELFCVVCHRYIANATGCPFPSVPLLSDGYLDWRERIRFGSAREKGPPGEHCPECQTARGELHHIDCPHERCPRCGGALALCDCEWADAETGALLGLEISDE